jgi:uncharacterized membrane protein HdeD (DUF308 family)
LPSEAAEKDLAKFWWVSLISGVLWMIAALIVLRFDATSVAAVAVLIGVVFISAGLTDFVIAGTVEKYRWLYVGLGVLLIAAGVVALFHPLDTFVALAAIVGWFLLIKGGFDIAVAIMQREYPLWWVTLIAGIIEIGLAFWAAGYFGRSAVLVVALVAAGAMIRGITHLVAAFRLYEIHSGGRSFWGAPFSPAH